MPNTETIRVVPGAKTAVLMVHGVLSTPNRFRALLPLEYAVREDWSLYNIVLDGHCKDVPAFGKSSMKKWKEQVGTLYDMLCDQYESIVLVGHSMGTLLSVRQALRKPEKVALLFLVNVPIPPFVRPHSVINSVRHAFGKGNQNDPLQIALEIDCGTKLTKKVWQYISWAPRFIELLIECRAVSKCLPKLQTPCIAWQSGRDELVAHRSVKVLRKKGTVEVHTLPRSTHSYYPDEEKKMVIDSFKEACKEI